MRLRARIALHLLGLLALGAGAARADSDDVAGSHDYPGFPRWTGSVITDYDEDNPAESDFPAARPLPIDSNNVVMVHVQGHRYVIQYELESGRVPSLLELQKYYEKLASDAGFSVEKTGATGDVSETFHKFTASHEIWVHFEPAITENVLTVVEAVRTAPPPPPPQLTITAPAPTIHPPADAPAPTPVTHAPAPATHAPAPAVQATPQAAPNDDSLFTELKATGRVVLPIQFLPGKDEIEASSMPLVDRIIAMMKKHRDIFLRIEGHTDNSGDPEDDMRLSAIRAFAVRDALIAARIDSSRLDAVGVGGLQPLADNNTAAGREQNRRIELVLRKKHGGSHVAMPEG